jgi:hypothetical protein
MGAPDPQQLQPLRRLSAKLSDAQPTSIAIAIALALSSASAIAQEKQSSESNPAASATSDQAAPAPNGTGALTTVDLPPSRTGHRSTARRHSSRIATTPTRIRTHRIARAPTNAPAPVASPEIVAAAPRAPLKAPTPIVAKPPPPPTQSTPEAPKAESHILRDLGAALALLALGAGVIAMANRRRRATEGGWAKEDWQIGTSGVAFWRSSQRVMGRIGEHIRFGLYLIYILVFDGGHRARTADDELFGDTIDPFVHDAAPHTSAAQSIAGPRSFLPNAVTAPHRAWAPAAADRIYAAFDASQPVDSPQDLRGRDEHIAQLMTGVLYRRTHALVSGPRGSGKTSLVRVFAQYAGAEGVVVLYAACDRTTTFSELMRDFLEQIPGYALDPDQAQVFADRVAQFSRESTAQQVASLLSSVRYSQLVFVIDESDRPENIEFRAKIASLLKLISDARLPVRLVVVSGSSIFDHIVGEHQSLMRHVTRLTTEPLDRSAVGALLESCASRCGMRFSPEAKKLLCQTVCGSPYHARLFGMHSALAALARKQNDIDRRDVFEGLSYSFDEWALLNEEDATSFVSIVSGTKGDPNQIVEAARRLASSAQSEEPAKVHVTGRADDERLLKALAPAVERANGGIAFRDATAPQFLFALQHLSTSSKRVRAKGGADV